MPRPPKLLGQGRRGHPRLTRHGGEPVPVLLLECPVDSVSTLSPALAPPRGHSGLSARNFDSRGMHSRLTISLARLFQLDQLGREREKRIGRSCVVDLWYLVG